ncbi:MAG: SDR family NAD(P)-dependent oxidoreductase [Muribaculum sp.]|nr:SDR family NAD(P)-dependent oxidoreductase [Muribaculum sp.]
MKRIVIMGASSGIGKALAETLASRGVRVGLAARHTSPLEDLKRRWPDEVEYERIDVNSREGPSRLFGLVSRLGGMDIYIHVAGIGYDNPDLNPDREASIIETNASGFARMTSAVFDWYRSRGLRGRIVGVTSVAGTKGIGIYSAYSASKKCAQTYLTALAQLACSEGLDIGVTDIRPGWIRTPLLHEDVKYPMEMSERYAVVLILRAIVERRRVAYIDCRWGILSRLWRAMPEALWIKLGGMVSRICENKK